MVTLSLKGVLTGILLIALIVLVIFLIVMVGKVTDLLKGVNAIMEGGGKAATAAAEGVTAKKNEIATKIAPVKKLLGKGFDVFMGIVNKLAK